MKREAATIPDPASPPERIAALLHVVRMLLAYGRHLADTTKVRATAPSFPAIAACFGTLDLSVIFTRLHRGILRAVALENVLLARAARGRDITFSRARIRPHDRQPAPAGPPANLQPTDQQPATRQPAPRSPRQPFADLDPPTLQELERQVRRRPIGRTIADICLDLAVVPGFCTGTFWNELFDAMHRHGGSLGTMLRERYHREQAFHRQRDKSPDQCWDFSDRRQNTPAQVLGFFIGEPPVLPLSPSSSITAVPAAATGPPKGCC